MSRQTAIEWLEREIARRQAIIDSEPDGIVKQTMLDNLFIDLFDQAKQMEIVQIKNAMEKQAEKYTTPYINEDGQPAISFDIDDSFNDYFTETYGKEESPDLSAEEELLP